MIRETAVSSRMLVLGLLIDEPDTASGAATRLRERFASGRFATSGVYAVTDRMLRDGLLKVVAGDEGRAAVRLEATDAGIDQFERWLSAGGDAPEMRDPTVARLALSRDLDDVKLLVGSIEKEQEACDAEFAKVRADGIVRKRSLARRRLERNSVDHSVKVDCALLAFQATLWIARARALQTLRANLKEIVSEAEADG